MSETFHPAVVVCAPCQAADEVVRLLVQLSAVCPAGELEQATAEVRRRAAQTRMSMRQACESVIADLAAGRIQ